MHSLARSAVGRGADLKGRHHSDGRAIPDHVLDPGALEVRVPVQRFVPRTAGQLQDDGRRGQGLRGSSNPSSWGAFPPRKRL